MSIPNELTARSQWVCWRYEKRGGRPTKVPINARTGAPAKTNDSSTWASYDEARAGVTRHEYDGLGFVFTREDPYVGIDLDGCRDPETGELEPQARALIDTFSTYAESSVSGSGVHLILRGTIPPGSRHRGRLDGLEVEVYGQGRYFVTTGQELT